MQVVHFALDLHIPSKGYSFGDAFSSLVFFLVKLLGFCYSLAHDTLLILIQDIHLTAERLNGTSVMFEKGPCP